MEFIAKSEGNTNIPKLEDGVYTAISSMLIDIGAQKSTIDNNVRRKFIMIWNIGGEFVEVNNEQLPRVMSKEYTLSLNEKSNLRKDLQAWRGKAFTEEELQGFDILTIMNKPCQLQIINEEKNGKTYNNISAIMAVPKGLQVEPLEETTVFITNNPETWNAYEKVPKWIREKIKKAEGYEGSELSQYISEFEKMEEQNKPEQTAKTGSVTAPGDDRTSFLGGSQYVA